MLELARERPVLFPTEEFDRFNRQIHRYAALVEDAQEYAEHCQYLVEELRAQVEEETNRNLYTLTMFSVIFLPATLIASIWGMNVGGIPFSGSSNRPREAGGRAAVRQRRAPSHWLRGSLGTRASLLGEKSGSPRGMAKVGGNVGCRVPVRG
jgi:hypothetical protein